jgi:hypothetical protein
MTEGRGGLARPDEIRNLPVAGDPMMLLRSNTRARMIPPNPLRAAHIARVWKALNA